MLKKKVTEESLHLFLDNIQDFVFYIDSNKHFQYVNDSFAKFAEKTPEEIIGLTEADIFPQDMVNKCEANSRIALEQGTFFEEEYLGDKWFQTFKARIEQRDGEIGILGIVREITTYKNMAFSDTLTGLYSRNFYETSLRDFYSKRASEPFSLILMDLDDFKLLNDSEGHTAGDILLKNIGKSLLENTRKEDWCIRMGGDEFCIVAFTDIEGARKIAERILDQVPFSLSIGIAERTHENQMLDELYYQADTELYRAKKRGKGCLSFNPHLSAKGGKGC